MSRRVYHRPIAIVEEPAAASTLVNAGLALPLAGGPAAFTAAEIIERYKDGRRSQVVSAIEVKDNLASFTAPRAALRLPDGKDLAFDRPLLMGIVNITPDSFSDGGQYIDSERAIAHGCRLIAEGADIIDIGGESTRPGASVVSVEEEQSRVLPVIKALAALGTPLSIDTRNAATMAAAVAAGAHIINDVSALSYDPASLATAAKLGAPVILMHALADPRTMQQNPTYDDVTLDIYDYLSARIAAAVAAGVPPSQLIIDPGIGFGKTVAHNLTLLRELSLFHGLGQPLLLGASRKSFIAKVTAADDIADRLPGSLSAALAGQRQGAQILRVHDVAATKRALKLAAAIAAKNTAP